MLQWKSSRNIKYKDYFVDDDSEEQDPGEKERSEPDIEEDEDGFEDEDEEDYEDVDDGEDFKE